MRKPARGRSPIPPEKRRYRRFSVPVNPDEQRRVLLAAARVNLPVTTWLRQLVFRSVDEIERAADPFD